MDKPSDEIDKKEWDRVINVNLNGVFYCTKHAAPYIKKTGGGSIINMSSVYGLVGGDDVPYHAAKGGVRLLTKSDAYYYGKNKIRVNSIHPGFIQTPLLDDVLTKSLVGDKEFREKIGAITLLGHLGEPDDVAYGVLYLASDESKYVTGIELTIDGGYTSQ